MMKRVISSRREAGHVPVDPARMAARLGSQRNLRCGDGHREEPLWSIRDRRRVRVHDGARRSGTKFPEYAVPAAVPVHK